MSDDVFLITGGGTGAKVAESLVHLCAAGLGPERLHLLLVDSDTANGNLRRTKETVRSYEELAQWPWAIRTRSSQGAFGNESGEVVELFGTEIEKHEITKEIKTVHQGGLETATETSEMDDVLDLLYDENEQRATCEDGFRARPNLGCLLMSEHLKEQFVGEASSFIGSLEAALSRHERVPVVVTASVFGGTGASLFPVIRDCVESSLQNEEFASKLDWSAVQMLPHYQPKEKKASVDPDRFYLDTSSALQYYSATQNGNGRGEELLFDAMYVVGSDDPGRNAVKTVLGSGEQANPPYFEEVVAGLSVLDAARRADGNPVRVYAPNDIRWKSLPHEDPESLRSRLALSLHLSAFYLQPSARGTDSQMETGLGAMVRDVSNRDLKMYGWYDGVLDDWAARTQEPYANADADRKVETLRSSVGSQSLNAMEEEVAEFFGRHLLWAETALKGEGLHFVDYQKGSYARLYDTMSGVEPEEVSVERSGRRLEPDQDNALVRLLRASAAALVYDARRSSESGLLDRVSLLDEDGAASIRITERQVRKALQSFGRPGVVDEYTRTRP
jgi:hypothetical protein